MTIELTSDEVTLLNQVLQVPLGAFGLDEVLSATKLSIARIEEITATIEALAGEAVAGGAHQLTVDSHDLKDLSAIYNAACKVIDHVEMHTLTGYSWDASEKLGAKLEEFAA